MAENVFRLFNPTSPLKWLRGILWFQIFLGRICLPRTPFQGSRPSPRFTTGVILFGPFSALGPPRVDFYRFLDVHFSTSIVGSFFNEFMMDLGSIFASSLHHV